MKDVPLQLIEACAKGERKAQYELYQLCYSFLVGIGMRYKHNKEDVDELVNLCFMKVLTNIDKYKKDVPFALWIRRIMINTIIDEFRKVKKMNELTETVDFTEQQMVEEDVTVNDFVRNSDAEYLYKLIAALPPVSGRVFNLFAVDGFNHKEIGELLGISEGTSKWHLNFARTKLKDQLLALNKRPQKVAL